MESMGLRDQLAALAADISGRPHERIPTPRPQLCWKSAADYALPPAAEPANIVTAGPKAFV
jgi:hypothetical protein